MFHLFHGAERLDSCATQIRFAFSKTIQKDAVESRGKNPADTFNGVRTSGTAHCSCHVLKLFDVDDVFYDTWEDHTRSTIRSSAGSVYCLGTAFTEVFLVDLGALYFLVLGVLC
jgi:hypothetical protein